MNRDQLMSQSSSASTSPSTSPRYSVASADSTNTSLSSDTTNSTQPSLSKAESSTGSDISSLPSKSDKPRPHICSTCARSFARLEHLKRHERSHTKEKPFECPECTRCFARRDLLLRHQQKLHLSSAPTRTKGSRRESTSGVSATSKVRKNAAGSVNNNNGVVRPRANTISHIDGSTLNYLATNCNRSTFNTILAQQANVNTASDYGLRIDTSGAKIRSFGYASMSPDMLFDVDENQPTGCTVNPAQLHLDDSAVSPFADEFDWIRGMNSHMAFKVPNEHAIDASTPSITHDSPIVANSMANATHMNGMPWTPEMYVSQMAENGALNLDYGSKLGLHTTNIHNGAVENYYPTPPPGSCFSPSAPNNGFFAYQPSLPFTPMTSTPALGELHQPILFSPAIGSITEITRQALITSLSQHSQFTTNNRRYSNSSINTPSSPHDTKSSLSSSLPSVDQLQRYIGAYIQYFHPHVPLLHIPTLSFDSPEYTNNLRSVGYASPRQGGIVGGGGCLILAMAAIGALYEFETAISRELFEAGKKLIQQYLEERRKADLAAASNSLRSSEQASQNTPLWLVQAMLLNVVYGHQCGDKVTGDIASTHCAALVSLARAAGLLTPMPGTTGVQDQNTDMAMQDRWTSSPEEDEQSQWHRWITHEERKRTLFALFHMSSLLVSGYNHAPSIMNSEIHLDLPCEEDLWHADCASSWTAKGGAVGAKQRTIPFSTALSTLLTASHHQSSQFNYSGRSGSASIMSEIPSSHLQPSTFGCLVLIDALHNYVWETRQRHSGRAWTTQETEAMHAHMEPALRAWQAAWASNPAHSLERPNPYGMGPLSADSIPLLDLAYVRLFVNLGVSKEAFWQRNFDAMVEELARGSDIMMHADQSETPSLSESRTGSRKSSRVGNEVMDAREEDTTVPPLAFVEQQTKSSKRERHLRKAAFYAADSLSMSDRLGVTFADFTSRELPIQSAMCTFDCAQVLAEWIATVQERVGRYLGILGQTPIDFSQVPAILLLEEEDCKLLGKIQEILTKAEAKMTYEISAMGAEAAMAAMNSLPSWSNAGYGTQILSVTAYMLKRAAVWPVTSLMAHGLEIQAAHMTKRASQSINMITPG